MSRIFSDLRENLEGEGRFVCLGLDPVPRNIPKYVWDQERGVAGDVVFRFLKDVVDATADVVAAYKPNLGFFEPLAGGAGFQVLERLIDYIHTNYRRIPVIVDGKRGDIGATSAAYAEALFGTLNADAITVSPYLGYEALKPFFENFHKGVFVLAKTSNPGAGEFQDLVLDNGMQLYEYVARRVANEWNGNKNCGVVAGATHAIDLARIRSAVGNDVPILIPGVGKQGGDLAVCVRVGVNSKGGGILVNNSSAALYASAGRDFAEKCRDVVLKMHDDINVSRSVR
jgi:orotidine-5'-phosphate decarboxylase